MVLNILKSNGVAILAPLKSAIPTPEKLPTQTPIVYFLLYPILHASRLPYDVPVFQGMPFLIGSQAEKDVLLDKIVEAIKKV